MKTEHYELMNAIRRHLPEGLGIFRMEGGTFCITQVVKQFRAEQLPALLVAAVEKRIDVLTKE